MHVNGYTLQMTRAAQGMPRSIKNAKIAMLDVDFRKSVLKFGVKMLMNDPEEIEKMRAKEIEMTESKLKLILQSGANVILTAKGIDDIFLKSFVDAKAIAVRRVEKKHLKRIARLTGGQVINSLADETGSESFPAEALG